MSRLNVLKTYKLFIGGEFPRTESGRFYQVKSEGRVLANVCLASRKDFRNAVVAARSAFGGWSAKSAMNRGQILYRIAEMVEGRKRQLLEELALQGLTGRSATLEVELAIDRLIYYSGWCDKHAAIFSTVNPVASSHYNFSVPEPMGVVCAIAPEKQSLLGLVSIIAPALAGGNTLVLLASQKMPLCAVTFGEALATSDLPPGVVNILTGSCDELHGHFSSHMDVNAVIYCRNSKEEQKAVMQNCSLNVKRFFHWNKDWLKAENQSPYFINELQEIKTTWHPIESGGAGGAKY